MKRTICGQTLNGRDIRPSYWTASARQDKIRSPLTSTVQAPWLHPFFVPVKVFPQCVKERNTRLNPHGMLYVVDP
jgi:hypothetical protein